MVLPELQSHFPIWATFKFTPIPKTHLHDILCNCAVHVKTLFSLHVPNRPISISCVSLLSEVKSKSVVCVDLRKTFWLRLYQPLVFGCHSECTIKNRLCRILREHVRNL